MQSKQLLPFWTVSSMELAVCYQPTEKLAKASVNCDGMKTAEIIWEVWTKICHQQHGQKSLLSCKKMITFLSCSYLTPSKGESNSVFYLCFMLNVIRVLCWQVTERLNSQCVLIIKPHPALQRGSSLLPLHPPTDPAPLLPSRALPRSVFLTLENLKLDPFSPSQFRPIAKFPER